MNWHICHKRKLLFYSYFWHISLCFYSNFRWESLLDVKFNFVSNEYPHCIHLMDPSTPKIRNTWKNVTPHTFDGPRILFSGISCFWRSGVRQKYAEWVLVAHPTSSPDRKLSKNTGRYVENTNKKIVFYFLPPKLINIILLF